MVTIKVFGTLRLKTGCKGLEADISSVKEGYEALSEATGLPYKEIKRSIVVVNGKQAKPATPLQDGDELAFFSPSGGG